MKGKKVIVSIPYWLYAAMLEHHEPVYAQSLGEAVRDGIPLPKGCERLFDERDIVNGNYTIEQEPCEDTIGRSDMLDAIGHGTTYTSEELQRIIKALPPANSQVKTGHWKHNKCDVCGASRPPLFDNYCPNCGSKMIEPQEREE